MFKFLFVPMFVLFTSSAMAQDPEAEVVPAVVTEAVAPVADEVVVPVDETAPTDEAVEAAPVDEAAVPADESAVTEDLPTEVPIPDDIEEAVEQTSSLVTAAQGGQWALALVLLLGLIVFVVNKFLASKKAVEPKVADKPKDEEPKADDKDKTDSGE